MYMAKVYVSLVGRSRVFGIMEWLGCNKKTKEEVKLLVCFKWRLIVFVCDNNITQKR